MWNACVTYARAEDFEFISLAPILNPNIISKLPIGSVCSLNTKRAEQSIVWLITRWPWWFVTNSRFRAYVTTIQAVNREFVQNHHGHLVHYSGTIFKLLPSGGVTQSPNDLHESTLYRTWHQLTSYMTFAGCKDYQYSADGYNPGLEGLARAVMLWLKPSAVVETPPTRTCSLPWGSRWCPGTAIQSCCPPTSRWTWTCLSQSESLSTYPPRLDTTV